MNRLLRALKVSANIILNGSYDVAKRNRQDINHTRNSSTSDRHPSFLNTGWNRSFVRRRARYEYDNNSYMRGMVSNYSVDTVGPTYPQLQVLTDNQSLNRFIQETWSEWAESYEINWPAKLSLLDENKTLEGEAFLSTFTDHQAESRVGISLNVKPIPARRVMDLHFTNGTIQDGKFNDDGVVIDMISGRPLYYQLTNAEDDLLSGYSTHPIIVSESEMFQWYRPLRIDQYRGISEIAPAIPLMEYMRRFTLATVSAAEFAASVAAFMYTDLPDVEVDDVAPWKEFPFNRAGLYTLPQGWKPEQLEAKHPIQNYEMFCNMLLRECGSVLNIPFGIVANDMSKYNFASGRLDLLAYLERKGKDRSQLSIRVQNRVHEKWIVELALRMVYSTDSIIAPMGRELLYLIQSNQYRYQWTFYNRPYSNPVDDAQANEINLRIGTTTVSDIYASRGLDIQAKWRQRSREIQMAKDMGLEELVTLTSAPSTPESTPLPASNTRIPVPSTNGNGVLVH